MERQDVPAVVAIHESSWGKSELSVKLGRRFTTIFYTEVVELPYADTFLYVKGDEIVGYATAFYDYCAFNQALLRRNFLSLILISVMRIIQLKLGPYDLYNLLFERSKLKKSSYPCHHLGAIALAQPFKRTPQGREALVCVFNHVFEEMVKAGCDGCSGSCDAANVSMVKYFESFGFVQVDRIKLPNRELVVLDKVLRK